MSIPSGGDKYRLIRAIGHGGMGVVYEAWDLRLDRRVALKILHPHLTAEAGSLARVEREARNAAKVEHPHVVRVYRIDAVDGQVVIEMQYVDGVPLGALLAEGALPPGLAVDLFRQTLEALAACHSHGIIHCDLKPANLLVTSSGHLYLTDFGISRATQPQAGGVAADGPPTGPLWGTPRYTPPEAWRGERPQAQWDLYSAGAVLHEALSGASLFNAPTPEAVMRLKLGEDLPPIRLLVPGLSSELAALVDGLTAREPGDRPASAREALAALKATPEFQSAGATHDDFEALYQGVRVADETTKVVDRRVPKRRRVWGRLGIGIAATLLLAGAIKPLWSVVVSTNRGEDVGVESMRLDSEIELAVEGVCFAYDDGVHGKELWHLAFGSKVAKLVQDIAPGSASSNPRLFFSREQSSFYFAASTPERGEELWVVDMGIGGEPRLVEDILPGPMGSDPVPVALMHGILLFEARTLAFGEELWLTNSLPSQTAMVADLHPGVGNSVVSGGRILADENGAYIVNIGGKPGEPAVMRLWRYDLASNAVAEIAPVHANAGQLCMVDGKLLFSNHDEAHGMELWSYDPSQSGIHLLGDLLPGPENSDPAQTKNWRGKVYFQAQSPGIGKELWCTDGTTEGTRLLKDLNPGSGDSDAYGYVETENALYFRAKDDAHGQELWMTDGTPEGTRMVKDVWPGPNSGIAYNIVSEGKNLFFTADDGVHGEELWTLALDDPLNTCRLVQDLRPGLEGSEAHNLTWWDDRWGVFVAWTAPETLQLVVIRHHEGDFSLEPVELP